MKRLFTIIALAAVLAFQANAQRKEDKDWANFSRYKQANTEVTVHPAVVLMGDSITQGWVEKDPDFFTDGVVLGRGISGQVTSHMLVRFRRDVLDFHPKYVAILAGINDIARNNGKIDKENILGNIISMVEVAKANKVKPAVCSILPCSLIGWRKELGNPTEEILWINGQLKEYARTHNIKYVDYYSAMALPEGGLPAEYSKDGVHPTKEGYKVMEEVLINTLKIKK